MSEFEPGVLIDGRYRVISRVGTGGMADVYLAQDQQLGREVALKLLHQRFAADPGFVERFRREAQAAASLQHPNVVSVFDRGNFGDTYYIAMEYLPGRSLKQLIRDEAPLEPVRAIDLTVQILKAARFAHRRGVIHRDLKPHNVIVDSSDHAKVTDFGIARAGASDMTETGSIMGTAQYLSPEQAQGHAVSGPSDLYSVGIILYEMLTGRVPFDGESPVAIALKHVSESPVPPSRFNSAIPPSLEQVVLWSLNKNPADRPADADQFIEALEQVRGSLVSGSTASMRAVGGGVAGAEGAGVAGAALLPAQGALAYGSSQNLMNGDRFDRYDEDADDDGRGIWPWLVGLLVLLLIAGGVLAFLLTRPAKVSVPYVTSLSLPVAEGKIETAGFTPNVLYLANKALSGTVIGQSPLGGAKAKQGSTVNLTVSSGPGMVSVPPVDSLTQKAATAAIKAAGLKVGNVIDEPSSTIPKGDVVATDPTSGTSISSGSPVTLYLSTGKPAAAKVRVPDVVGDSLPDAQQALSNFVVKTVPQTTTSVPANTVITQYPSARTLVKPGSTVTLTVAVAPNKVPDVVGYTASAAASTLQGDGYKVLKTYQLVTNAGQNGIVISQSPKPKASASKGTTVTIVIGQYSGSTTTSTSTTTTATTTTGTTTIP